MVFMKAFSNTKYLKSQLKAIQEKMDKGKPTFIEFGGKPFGDNHASRVLPGYDPDIKIEILKRLNSKAKIVMAVNAKDIFSPPYGRYLIKRVRGDSGFWYDDETISMILKARELGFVINTVVVTVVPLRLTKVNKEELKDFKKKLRVIGVTTKINYSVYHYPKKKSIRNLYRTFERNDRLVKGNKSLIVFSPGGGSGKFGVILSEIYHALKDGYKPNFIKFETFPVFHLNYDHPLNLAFEAATVDLKNKVKETKYGTNYDKDIENFRLMKQMVMDLDGDSPLAKMKSPLDWGVNQIETGITNMDLVHKACKEEVVRRLERYTKEVESGIERSSTVKRVENVLKLI